MKEKEQSENKYERWMRWKRQKRNRGLDDIDEDFSLRVISPLTSENIRPWNRIKGSDTGHRSVRLTHVDGSIEVRHWDDKGLLINQRTRRRHNH